MDRWTQGQYSRPAWPRKEAEGVEAELELGAAADEGRPHLFVEAVPAELEPQHVGVRVPLGREEGLGSQPRPRLALGAAGLGIHTQPIRESSQPLQGGSRAAPSRVEGSWQSPPASNLSLMAWEPLLPLALSVLALPTPLHPGTGGGTAGMGQREYP